MPLQTINIGSFPSDGSGDPLRVSFDKINQNFGEVFAILGNIALDGNIDPNSTPTGSTVTSVAGRGPDANGDVKLYANDIIGGVTQGYVTNQVNLAVANEFNSLVDAAPEALDTLRELSDAIANDPQHAINVMDQLANRLPKTGGTMTGPLYLSSDPTTEYQAATKQYVDLKFTSDTTLLASKADKSSVYTKSEIDAIILNITSASDNWGYITSDFDSDWGLVTQAVTATEDYGSIS